MAHNPKSKLTEEQEDVYKTVDTVNSQLQTLENFISRRFDEISVEINASSQQFDMAEDGIAKRVSEILEVLGAIGYSGNGGGTSANTGVELEAVIEDTENAANSILDAADRIAEYVSDGNNWNDDKTREEIRENIKGDVQEILMACTFQDLTGQRIRNTLNNLHSIEERLSSTFERLGIKVETDHNIVQEHIREASDQSDIDDMFTSESKNTKATSQNDIDGMFD
ncbi:MAG: protein phosphatase CheZ [Alphaproteobacteria bacterium]|nr:protein phosphatase CheZ [Alphaproteobacteria bacterium]